MSEVTQTNIEGGDEKKQNENNTPTDQQSARVRFVYDERADMLNKRDQTYPQFNDRTLSEFIDDNDKRMNAYVLSKEAQGKESWQANFATRAYANKAKALLAALARDIPDFKVSAVTENDQFDFTAGDISRELVRHSYEQGNPQEEMFFLSWSCVGKGTVFSYEGIGQQSFAYKKITSFDLLTGDVEWKEEKKRSYFDPVSFEIPLQDLLIKNFYIRDIQEQPSICWDSYYATRDQFDADWENYPNAKFVKDGQAISPEEQDTYFFSKWAQTLNKNKGYVVSRYMNIYKDVYRIIANGVELYNGPMLWRDPSRPWRKAYPIAKTIYEPFATSEFFYGNSLPNSAMGEGDVLNTLYNTALDKTYRSMVPPLLVGMVNKDMLDLEDEVVAGDTKIYVEDISQVKEMEIKGITSSDVQMIDLISKGLDLTTLDPSQQGAATKYVTARAAVAADERARQLKGLFFMFIESLWMQKIKLRLANVLISYTKPQLEEVIGEDNVGKLIQRYRRFNIKNTGLSDGNKGVLAVQMTENKESATGMMPQIEAEEKINNKEFGKPFEMIALAYDYFDNLRYDFQIIPSTLWQSSQAITMAMSIEKINVVAGMFPEYFMSNKELFFKDLMKAYQDDPTKYTLPQTQTFDEAKQEQMANGGGGGKESGNSQMVSDLTGVDRNNRLSKLSGVEV